MTCCGTVAPRQQWRVLLLWLCVVVLAGSTLPDAAAQQTAPPAVVDLLIEVDGQQPLVRRVTLDTPQISALDALQRAGIAVALREGRVCSLNAISCPDTNDCSCWQQAGWGSTGWQPRTTSIGDTLLQAGDLEGWRQSTIPAALPRLSRTAIAGQVGIVRLREEQQEPDGSIGFPGLNIDTIIGVAANQQNVRAWRNSTALSPVDGMRSNAPAYVERNAASAGKLVLGILAANEQPRSFVSTDLVQRLRAYYNPTAQAFGATDPVSGQFFPGSNWDQAFGILGLQAAGVDWNSSGAARTLAARANSDGGWGFAPISKSDTDSTGLVLQALASVPADSTIAAARERGLAWLRASQNNDGGFPTEPGLPSNVNSTAYVLQGILASGNDPQSPTWTKTLTNPVHYLLSQQTGDGTFPGFNNVLALAQVLPALTGTTLHDTPRQAAVARGQAWIITRQQANGSFSNNPEATFEAVQALAATRPTTTTAEATYQAARRYLTSIAPTYGSTQAGATARLILALLAVGGDPRTAGGVDLLARLQGFTATATPAGAFQTGITAADQAWALLALHAMRQPVAPASASYLRSLALPTGGWAATPASDALHVPTTALALQALAVSVATPPDSSVQPALRALRAAQNDDGGIGNDPGEVSNAAATGALVQALLATGQEPRSLAWSTTSPTSSLILRDPMRWLATANLTAAPSEQAARESYRGIAGLARQSLPVQREPFRAYLPAIIRSPAGASQ